MLIVDLYSLLPAFTVMSFLLILLWPENITYKTRLRLFMIILVIWTVASLLGMAGFGTSENRTFCLINFIVGIFGLFVIVASYWMKPTRD